MKKTAIFGSSFHPPHLGHLYLLQMAQKYFDFDVIKIIPTGVHPLSPKINLPSGRLELVKKIFNSMPYMEVEDREIKKTGISWTIDTLKSLKKENPKDRFFIIIGLDQWALFDQWKNFKSLLKKAHIVIINRKGHKWPESTPPFIKSLMFIEKNKGFLSAGPSGIKGRTQHEKPPFVQTYALKKNSRLYGRNIYYLDLKGWNISSSEVRTRFKNGESVEHLVPKEVCLWMKNKALASEGKEGGGAQQKDLDPKVPFAGVKSYLNDYLPVALSGALTLLKEKKGQKVKVFDLRKEDCFPFDWTVVVSGLNTRHTKALSESLKKTLRESFGLQVQNIEGDKSGKWIVLDYGDMVVHVFYDYTREYYRLEELWQAEEVCL